MSSHIIYGCHCLNIKIHLSSKYKFNQEKSDATFVNDPLPGWQLDLGMGGIIVEYSGLINTKKNKAFLTVSCLNCELSPVYSIKELDSADNTQSNGRVIVHEKALCGEAFEAIKKTEEYSNTFNIKVAPTSTTDLPKVIPEELNLTQDQLKSVLNQSIEKLSLESQVRIENFKKEEERKLQDFVSQAKLENTYLLTKLINIHDEEKEAERNKKRNQEEEEVEDKRHHVRFNDKVDDIEEKKNKRKSTTFVLDENQIRGLENKIITDTNLGYRDEEDDEEEEDMFNLDEEFSEEEQEKGEKEDGEEEEEEESTNHKSHTPESSHDVLGTSWMRKKRNTGKYMIEDFDISRFKNTASRGGDDPGDEDVFISKYATSVPISIHYPQFDEENNDEDANDKSSNNNSNKKDNKDILVSSFANYDFSYPDRMLSAQFPQRRRKSLTSKSLIRPQLDTLVGKSLDTRGIMQKRQNIREKDEENFGPMLPPHLYTAMTEEDEEEDGGA